MNTILRMYTPWSINNKDNDPEAYKLRLRTKDIIQLTKTLGKNPLNVFLNMANNSRDSFEFPIEDLLKIIHASLQCFQHNIQFDDVYDMYDVYIDNGGNIGGLINIVMEVFKVSGLLPEDKKDNIETSDITSDMVPEESKNVVVAEK